MQRQFINVKRGKRMPGIVIWDFDGVFSGSMSYTENEKYLKHVQYCARHSVEMLSALGFEQHIVTGDTSETGKKITSKIVKNWPAELSFINNSEKVKLIAKISASTAEFCTPIFFVGDDIFDANVTCIRNVEFITSYACLSHLKSAASYVSQHTMMGYFAPDVAFYLAKRCKLDFLALAYTKSAQTAALTAESIMPFYYSASKWVDKLATDMTNQKARALHIEAKDLIAGSDDYVALVRALISFMRDALRSQTSPKVFLSFTNDTAADSRLLNVMQTVLSNETQLPDEAVTQSLTAAYICAYRLLNARTEDSNANFTQYL